MALFQSSVLKKYLAAQEYCPIHEEFTAYLTYFHNPRIRENIRDSKKTYSAILQADITCLGREIDATVYELYGLTEEEIKIVEGGEG